jgi:tetratricopeptide (TPR) repeat protein
LESLLAARVKPPIPGDREGELSQARFDLSRAGRWITIGQIAQAEALTSEALTKFTSAGEHQLAAFAWGQIAKIRQHTGDLDEALRIRRDEQLPIVDRVGDFRARAIILGSIADILKDRGDLDAALLILREEQLPVFDRLHDLRSRAVTMGAIADILDLRGDLDEAVQIRREEELPVYDRLGDVHSRAITMGKIADLLTERGDLGEALRIRLEEQLPVFDRLGDVRHRAITWGKIADIIRVRGDLDEALRIWREEALPAYDRLGDIRLRAIAMSKVGDILQTLGDLDEALRIWREQLPIFERLGCDRDRSAILAQISLALIRMGGLENGRFQEIFDALAESYGIALKLRFPEGIGKTGVMLAIMMMKAGRSGEALVVLEKAEAAFQKLGKLQDISDLRRLREQIKSA